jgi:hypothetical protein
MPNAHPSVHETAIPSVIGTGGHARRPPWLLSATRQDVGAASAGRQRTSIGGMRQAARARADGCNDGPRHWHLLGGHAASCVPEIAACHRCRASCSRRFQVAVPQKRGYPRGAVQRGNRGTFLGQRAAETRGLAAIGVISRLLLQSKSQSRLEVRPLSCRAFPVPNF